jgi:hypothetical protein
MGVGYVRLYQAAALLELNEERTCLAGRIYPTRVGYVRPSLSAMILEPDSGSDMYDASDISDLELNENIRPGRIYPMQQ